MAETEQSSEVELEQRLADEGYAVNPGLLSNQADDNTENRYLDLNEGSERNLDGDNKIPGYISNEIYEPIKKYEKIIEKEKMDDNTTKNIMDLSINEIIENTSQCLNDFDSEFLSMLYKVDLENDYTYTNNGFTKNVKRYFMAFIMYLKH